MFVFDASQCTYRCVVLPDFGHDTIALYILSLNAPTGRLFSGLMAVLSCADHLRSAGPRRSDRRSRVRSARLGVRGAAAPGAAVREIAG